MYKTLVILGYLLRTSTGAGMNPSTVWSVEAYTYEKSFFQKQFPVGFMKKGKCLQTHPTYLFHRSQPHRLPNTESEEVFLDPKNLYPKDLLTAANWMIPGGSSF